MTQMSEDVFFSSVSPIDYNKLFPLKLLSIVTPI